MDRGDNNIPSIGIIKMHTVIVTFPGHSHLSLYRGSSMSAHVLLNLFARLAEHFITFSQ